VFCGDSHHSVDAKNRVFVPKRFQQDLPLDENGNRFAILTRGLDGCLFLFPELGLERALERMDTQAFAAADQRKLQRLFFSYTSQVTLDASGRLLLPEKLRKLAGIEREVVMVGVVDRVEIWSAARWEAFESENGAAFEELENVLTGVSPGSSGSSGSPESPGSPGGDAA
jgi:MraZ protein